MFREVQVIEGGGVVRLPQRRSRPKVMDYREIIHDDRPTWARKRRGARRTKRHNDVLKDVQ
jgi:hypothetical protein